MIRSTTLRVTNIRVFRGLFYGLLPGPSLYLRSNRVDGGSRHVGFVRGVMRAATIRVQCARTRLGRVDGSA